MQQPDAFEFEEDFLLATSEALESCQFGTFLCNNLREREIARVASSTASAWSVLLDHFGTPAASYDPNMTHLTVNHQKLRLWARCHLQRWGSADLFPVVQ